MTSTTAMMDRASIEQRVVRAAEAALRDHGYVAPVDVLVGMGWLQPVHRDHWRQGRVPYRERDVQAGLAVVRFSRSRKRYERQGILVEEDALQEAEASCLADADARARRVRDEERRREADGRLAERLAEEITRLFPGCPRERADAIAAHTAARGSGGVGRTAAGQRLDEDAVELAVVASVRHRDTDNDALLMAGVRREVARRRVREDVEALLDRWRSG